MRRTVSVAIWFLVVFASSSVSAQMAWDPVVGGDATTPDGFGSANNRVALSMAPFASYLYVGTYNEITGAEVWRSSNGTSWSQANADNFGQNIVTNINYGAYSMGVFSGYLYAGTWGGFVAADETRMFRTNTGASWTQTNLDGFGDNNNAEPLAQAGFDGVLYVGVANYPDGAELQQSLNGANWFQLEPDGFGDTNNIEISALETDDVTLWSATGNQSTGVEVWALTSGVGWGQINADGFGSANNQAAYAMEVFGDALYVATYNGNSGLEVWRYRSTDIPAWTAVAVGGFGDANNLGAYDMAVHNGGLYVATYNATGAEIWRSQNGTSWSQVNSDGFGTSSNYSVTSLDEFGGYLYAGTANGGGAEVWRVQGPFFADGFEPGDTGAWN